MKYDVKKIISDLGWRALISASKITYKKRRCFIKEPPLADLTISF